MMKTLISQLLLAYSLKSQTIPTITTGALDAYRCMGVAAGANSTTNTTCDSCFNWSTAARAYNIANAHRCSAIITTNAITDCQIYSGTYTDVVSTTSPDDTSCRKCTKTYYNVKAVSNGGNMSASCSDTKGDGCTGKINNCVQTICYMAYSSGTAYSSQFCTFCQSGYVPAENDIWDKGAQACTKGKVIDNCKYLASTGSNIIPYQCYGCNKNFALAGASASGCIGFTSDENCSAASTTDDGCMTCWNAYFFSGATCTLRSNLILGAAILAIALIALIN